MRRWVILPALGAGACLLLPPFHTYLTGGPFIVTLLYVQITLLQKLPPEDPRALFFTTCALIGPVLLVMGGFFTRRSPWWYALFTAIFLVGSWCLPHAVRTERMGNPVARRVQWLPPVLALGSAAAYLVVMKRGPRPMAVEP